MQIVNITLDRAVDDAQAIFESLNSTGKELSESDLIRNYVLMGLESTEQSLVYEHYWRPMELHFSYETQESIMDRFFRDYLTMKLTRIPNRTVCMKSLSSTILIASSAPSENCARTF